MTYANPLNVTLKNLKTFNGLEGQGFSATMYVGGLLTADIIDDANGGCYNIHAAYDRKAQKQVDGAKARLEQVEAFIKTLPIEPWPANFGDVGTPGFQPDLDAFLSALVEDMQAGKILARYRKANTLFRLKTDKTDKFRPVNILDRERVKAMLDKKYGADNYEFI